MTEYIVPTTRGSKVSVYHEPDCQIVDHIISPRTVDTEHVENRDLKPCCHCVGEMPEQEQPKQQWGFQKILKENDDLP